MQRWYEAMHQAILNIELHKLNICGAKTTNIRTKVEKNSDKKKIQKEEKIPKV